KGDKVAFMLFNCNELFEIIYACSKIGAVFIPINSRFIDREIKHVLNNSEAKVLIYDERFQQEVQRAVADTSSVSTLISVGAGHTSSTNYESFIATHSIDEP